MGGSKERTCFLWDCELMKNSDVFEENMWLPPLPSTAPYCLGRLHLFMFHCFLCCPNTCLKQEQVSSFPEFLRERALSEGNLGSREEPGSSSWAGWSSWNFPWYPVSPLGPWLLCFWVVGKREDGGGFEHGFWAGVAPAWMLCPAPIVGSGLWTVPLEHYVCGVSDCRSLHTQECLLV